MEQHATMVMVALEFVFLGDNSVRNSGAAALALALKENRKIQGLKLMHNNITAQGWFLCLVGRLAMQF
jgi:Ran GTPase-activating protein (RanGAP) involved in mRNA processing and transport